MNPKAGEDNSDQSRSKPQPDVNGYAFNQSSRLYEPNPKECESRTSQEHEGAYPGSPLYVEIRRDWVSVVFSFFTIILLVVTVIYAHNQWIQTQRSADASNRSADAAIAASISAIQQVRAAEDSNILARQNSASSERQSRAALNASIGASRIDQRAWLSVGIPASMQPEFSVGQIFKSNIYVMNTGKTPAIYVLRSDKEEVLPKGARPNFDELSKPIGKTSIAPGAYLPPTITIKTSVAISPGDYDRVVTSQTAVEWAYGRVDYDDVFGYHHWTRFCFTYSHARNSLDACETHNDIDKESR